MFSKLFDSSKGKTFHQNRTICEINRELYDIFVLELHNKDVNLLKKIVSLLEDSFLAGVKMNRKLIRYKLGSSSKWREKEYDKSKIGRKKLLKIRNERIRLEKILIANNKILRDSKKNE